MTHRERFIKALKCEPIGGQVPTFELVFYLTMEAFGKVHPLQRRYDQWNQMSQNERNLHMNEMAQIYIDTAEKYGHSAIFVHCNPGDYDNTKWLLETIREKTGDEYFIMMHGDSTWAIPDGDSMMDFAVQMYEEPEKLNEISARRTENALNMARRLHEDGHLLDGFALCSDYCFNTNPFFNEESFDELIVPYLKEIITEYRKMGYYSIKHTDGNIMPILKQIADCKPDALYGFAPDSGKTLSVELPAAIPSVFPAEKLGALKAVLANDPRPRYQKDPERIYAMEFAGFEVRFRVSGETVYIMEIA